MLFRRKSDCVTWVLTLFFYVFPTSASKKVGGIVSLLNSFLFYRNHSLHYFFPQCNLHKSRGVPRWFQSSLLCTFPRGNLRCRVMSFFWKAQVNLMRLTFGGLRVPVSIDGHNRPVYHPPCIALLQQKYIHEGWQTVVVCSPPKKKKEKGKKKNETKKKKQSIFQSFFMKILLSLPNRIFPITCNLFQWGKHNWWQCCWQWDLRLLNGS